MCTAITFQSNFNYFGRNLDFEHNFGEQIVIAPRNFDFHFHTKNAFTHHYAMIGMAVVDRNYPLYFDATNEHGLSMAGLYFPDNAVYFPKDLSKDNIAPFEFIPWILSQCQTVSETEILLNRLNLIDLPYSDAYPLTPLHWIIADRTGSIVVEQTKQGLNIYQNPIGVLTNNPPFPYQLWNLSNYLNLTSDEPISRFSDSYILEAYSRGMGAMGMPGDLSSSSRFVKASFTKLNSVCGHSETESISQFFHILNSVAQQQGCVKIGDKYEKTIYSSCCNVDKGIYYYTTYLNSQITGVCMYHTDLNTNALSIYPLVTEQQIRMVN